MSNTASCGNEDEKMTFAAPLKQVIWKNTKNNNIRFFLIQNTFAVAIDLLYFFCGQIF